jgi:lysophospholipase L1-like esterase
MVLRSLVLVAVALGGAAAGYWASGRSRLEPGTARVLLVGDSLAVGLGRPLAALAAASGVHFASASKGGTVVDQWASGIHAKQLQDALDGFKPTLVLVSLGANDELRTISTPERVAPEIQTLLDRCEAAGAEVLWIGPPDIPETYVEYRRNHQIVPLLESTIPAARYFRSEDLDLPQPDKLHPSPAGYVTWASAIWEWAGKTQRSPGAAAAGAATGLALGYGVARE